MAGNFRIVTEFEFRLHPGDTAALTAELFYRAPDVSATRRALPKGACQVKYSAAGPGRESAIGSDTAAALTDQAELPRAGHGLGAVGRAELVHDVADVLLDGVEGYDKLAGDGLVRFARG